MTKARTPAGIFEAVDCGDVRMIERCEDLGLALEARHALWIRGERSGEDFERDITAELGIACAIDFAHSASTERAENCVGAEARLIGKRHRQERRLSGRKIINVSMRLGGVFKLVSKSATIVHPSSEIAAVERVSVRGRARGGSNPGEGCGIRKDRLDGAIVQIEFRFRVRDNAVLYGAQRQFFVGAGHERTT